MWLEEAIYMNMNYTKTCRVKRHWLQIRRCQNGSMACQQFMYLTLTKDSGRFRLYYFFDGSKCETKLICCWNVVFSPYSQVKVTTGKTVRNKHNAGTAQLLTKAWIKQWKIEKIKRGMAHLNNTKLQWVHFRIIWNKMILLWTYFHTAFTPCLNSLIQ